MKLLMLTLCLCESEAMVRSSRRRSKVRWILAGALVTRRDFFERIMVNISVAITDLSRNMHPRALWASSDICLRCRWRIVSQSPRIRLLQTCRNSNVAPKLLGSPSQRGFHASAPVRPALSTPPYPLSLTISRPHTLWLPQHPSILPSTPSSLLVRQSYPFATI